MTSPDLFSAAADALRPLAERMRPQRLEEMVGQAHLLAPGSSLRRAIESGHIHSMLLWGPPGCGKTTLALLLAQYAKARFQAISAVLSGVAEVRQVTTQAAQHFATGQRTVLFVDEVHRFNKAQQDAFLPHIERGNLIFVGATTENPSFELNAALLSRCKVYVLHMVSATAIAQALQRALHDRQRGLGQCDLQISDELVQDIAQASDGDVRRALNYLEMAANLAADEGDVISESTVHQVLAQRQRRFDKGGDQFYELISALHKSVRNSNPDAAVYWLARLLDGGCDPAYLLRRLSIIAVEDIGLADPRALEMAINVWQAYERIGPPQAHIALSNLVIYLASAAKSNACYLALKAAQDDVIRYGSVPVPLHLRNAPTGLMKSLGYAQQYQYDHDVDGGVALEQTCFPEAIGEKIYYQPVARGLEIKLKEKLDQLRALREQAKK